MQIVLDALVKLQRIICLFLRVRSLEPVLDWVGETPPGCSCRRDPTAGVSATKSQLGLGISQHIQPQWEPTAAWIDPAGLRSTSVYNPSALLPGDGRGGGENWLEAGKLLEQFG